MDIIYIQDKQNNIEIPHSIQYINTPNFCKQDSFNADVVILDTIFNTRVLKKLKDNFDTKKVITITDEIHHATIKEYDTNVLLQPFEESDLLEMIEKIEKTSKKKTPLIDYLDAKIVVLNSKEKVLYANKSFLDNFNLKNKDEFNKNFKFKDVIIDHNDYFVGQDNWLDSLEGENDKDILMLKYPDMLPSSYIITSKKVKNNYLVLLHDITKLSARFNKAEDKAIYDPLTEVFNRVKFNDVIDEYHEQFKRYKIDLSFAIFDIDHFKSVNDTYGHNTGDEVLKQFATIISYTVRTTDIFARWGGEEFVLLMPHTDAKSAQIAVEKIRKEIENSEFEVVKKITCSIGISQFKDGDSVKDVVERADGALYVCKENGRNQSQIGL